MNKIRVILVFVVAFLLSFVALNQSLWLDEATTARVISQYGYFEIISKFSVTDFHPPLYYLIMKLWSSFFGFSEVALRMPSILFSLGAGYFIYLIGGIWAAMFFLFNPLIVYYSQEARMYLMATFFLTAALYYLQRISTKKISEIIIFSIFITLAFYTFYGSVFLIIPMYIYLFYKKNYRAALISSAIFGIFTVPLIYSLTLKQLENSRIALSQVANWSSVLGRTDLKNLLLIPVKFSVGRIDFYPKWLYYAVAGGWTALVATGLKDALKKENAVWLFLVVSPVILGLFFSIFSPLLQYFRFLYLIPILSILLAFRTVKTARWQPARLTGLVVGFAAWTLAYLFFPQFHREDWKSLAESLNEKTPVYMIASSSDPLRYYRRELEIHDLAELSQLKSTIPDFFVIVPYTADIHGVGYKEMLIKKGFEHVGTRTFRDLTYENWRRLK